jgi:formate hydrogenlyase subunit 3/multisubunit Na+/H+ antiporter MnhD subunit
MSAVLPAVLSLAAPAPDAGLFAAVIVAAGVTALVAIGMMVFGMHRHSRLTAVRALATVGLALGVVGVAVGGVFAVSPTSAQAAPEPTGPTYVVTSTDPDIQLPTLAGD